MSAIALLGTSADPPTCGHQALLEQLLAHFTHVVTWASDNPGKQHALPLAQRSALLQALVQSVGDPRLTLVQELSSPWAITTLERAEALWPGQVLCFVSGSDLMEQVLRWKEADALLARCRLIIVPREGWPLNHTAIAMLRRHGAQLDVLSLHIPGTASSSVRRDTDPSQIPAVLRPLLMQNKFYGFDTDSGSAAL